MANNVVAYIGYDSFDIILYLSRIFQKLGHKILIADYSEAEALTFSIPHVEGIDLFKSILTYRQVDFTRMIITEDIINSYDDVLIDFGYSKPEINLFLISKVVYVTNMFKYNLSRLSSIRYYDELQVNRELLIREAIELKIPIEIMAELINKQINEKEISVLYLEDRDYENSLIGHYNSNFRFTRISAMLKTYLLKSVSYLYKNISKKQILSAYVKARKGE